MATKSGINFKSHQKSKQSVCKKTLAKIGMVIVYMLHVVILSMLILYVTLTRIIGLSLITTSSFMVKADIARKIGQAWYGQWGADRQFFNALKQYFPNYSCSREYSLCYRLDGNPNSVNAEFFEKGNAENEKQYPDGFPWKQQFKEEYIVGPGITIVSG